MPFELDSRAEYNRVTNSSGGSTPISTYYLNEDVPWAPPKEVKYKDEEGNEQSVKANARRAKPSLFNRYAIFYFNSINGPNAPDHEEYMDGVNFGTVSGRSVHNRRKLGSDLLMIERDPTAANIIKWAKSGSATCLDYAWEDFLWCKNYGMIPNNYMITLRRFAIPAMDDLTSDAKNPSPDIARMITWVDGEVNTWESAGLKWEHSLTWKEFESEIQVVNSPQGAGNEGGAFPGMIGNIMKAVAWATQPGSNEAALGNPAGSTFDPYQDTNRVYGPVDVIKKVMMREKGLEFTQQFTIKFEYELRSIDGVNPRIAMIDLLSNVMQCTMNRGSFWGGETKYVGGEPRRIKPFGNTSELAKGNFGGYISSLIEGLGVRLDTFTGGAGLTLEGLGNAAKNLGSSLLANIVGGGLDKAGRPGVAAVNSLLTGEDTGEWHVMVGNPANPIISVGNLILEKTDIQFNGALGIDDFPTALTVTCTLKPARPRDRTDILSMFHKNARTYLSTLPSGATYTGNNQGGRKNGRAQTSSSGVDMSQIKEFSSNAVDSAINTFSSAKSILELRFPNHKKSAAVVDTTAQGTV
jgi:hypothetical protein